MSPPPDAWDDEWSTTADTPEPAPSKLSTKQTKAQKRAAQAEFNRQLWADAETPQATNYFLESRNVVPLRQEFKAPPTLLSRKGPILQKSRPVEAMQGLKLDEESSEDEDEAAAQVKALEAAKVQAAREREEKQKKYEERRLELFGPAQESKSGGSSPNMTPPGSRSATPNRRRGRGRGQGGRQVKEQTQHQNQQQNQQLKEVYDPQYAPKPALLRREPQNKDLQPIREPKAPDGTGRGGGGFVQRRSMVLNAAAEPFQY